VTVKSLLYPASFKTQNFLTKARKQQDLNSGDYHRRISMSTSTSRCLWPRPLAR